ncbi:uncharacterized protein P174DRAFT_425184 [Aspergillus novofumigatus IBT 16806]|uniref:Cytochrome P450 n=1 Tax=Aspergillus novofumigatus (strain IBT 16806) TaxID=1392255 RepID=A0A2I1BV36_ASPN1|nr:uncharacterized protein P174DRAFT_425184 [Aspergillus novofumigatus IBT 16806]PKX89253.1 hypothetical protein P174DRAFT_425184 [Aspergillus novofumigatus IBT 16806]
MTIASRHQGGHEAVAETVAGEEHCCSNAFSVTASTATAVGSFGSRFGDNEALIAVQVLAKALASIEQKFPAHRDSSFYQYDWPGHLTAFAYELSNPTLDSFQPEFLIQIYTSTVTGPLIAPAVDGAIITKLWGMMPSTPSMVIVIVLLSIDISVLVLVFALRRNNFDGPRIPKSVGSLIPCVARSRIAPDFRGASRMMDSEQRDYLMQRSHKYTFGLSLCPVVIDAKRLNADPATWGKDSDIYHPERFWNILSSKLRYRFMQFGVGVASGRCLGKHLADTLFKLTLMAVLKQYSLHSGQGGPEIELRYMNQKE